MSDSDKSWKYWGSKDPYYGVLTSEQFRKENLTAESKKEFFASGEQHISSILEFIRNNIDPGFTPHKSIDFGCGTGRLLIPLAKRSKEVVGIDISETMLLEAKKNCDSESLNNVEFIISTDDLDQLQGSYDLIHSYIVFQHIPVLRGEKIIENFISHLSPSGIGVFHVTYYRNASNFRKKIHWLREKIPLFHILANIFQGQRVEPKMQMNEYSINKLFQIFQNCGIKRVFSQFTIQEGYHGAILYISKKEK